jgi:hypothetical protein
MASFGGKVTTPRVGESSKDLPGRSSGTVTEGLKIAVEGGWQLRLRGTDLSGKHAVLEGSVMPIGVFGISFFIEDKCSSDPSGTSPTLDGRGMPDIRTTLDR